MGEKKSETRLQALRRESAAENGSTRRTRLVRGRQVRGPVASARSSLNLCPLARDEVTEGSGGELFSRCTLWRAILGFVLHVHPTALILIRIREERCADSGKQCERQGGKTRARE